MKVLAPECMLRNKLKRHLKTYQYIVIEPHDLFARMLIELKQQKMCSLKTEHSSITGELNLSAAVDVVNIMIGKSVAKHNQLHNATYGGGFRRSIN
ncbi:hypothetical protein CEXT_708551 [Caerostris extrusa]|uniref:Uncharacterized protein n=1 Tax=Caerostris extrusa TaxID=172846 RepID=A0AAV4S4S5_CAEEX|nr:hypothetical protein CEXT_708551 [Caerostris extrusa]